MLSAQYQEKREKVQSVATEYVECQQKILKKLEKNTVSQPDNAFSLETATDFYNKILFGNYPPLIKTKMGEILLSKKV